MGCCLCKEDVDFDGEVDLSHFSLLRSVGKGAFGKVRVVEHKRTKQMYALKYINKAKCVAMRAVENTLQERRLLEEINCPFVCNLRYAFQDDENLFMVLDLMLGGDLRFHLDKAGTLPEDQVQFYAAEIGAALSYLHSKNIVHRDIKPENVLLDYDGHAHLTDFNVAVKVKEGKMMTALAGSLAYMAPEILIRKGYTAAVDWWSLGVLLYELTYGKRPFRGKNNDALTQSILQEPAYFVNLFSDREPISQNCTTMIGELLNRNYRMRLGSKESGGFVNFQKHKFFEGIDWILLNKKGIEAPFVPDSKKVNFDATHELEELLLEDNPLTTNKKRRNSGPRTLPNGEEIPREQLILEEKFKVFDFTKPKANEPVSEEAMNSISAALRKLSMTRAQKQAHSDATTAIKQEKPPTINEGDSMHKDVMEGREEEVLAKTEKNAKDADTPKTSGSKDGDINHATASSPKENEAQPATSPST